MLEREINANCAQCWRAHIPYVKAYVFILAVCFCLLDLQNGPQIYAYVPCTKSLKN